MFGLLGALVLCAPTFAAEEPPHSAELDAMIIKEAKLHGVPERLVRRVVMRESRYNPRARNHRYWGLMQISYPTAKSMGFKGTPQELLNPLTNLTYAVPYLANAFVAAGKREDAAVRLYAHGYYDAARRQGLLGLLRTADSAPVAGYGGDPNVVASVAPVSNDYGIFGALVSPLTGSATTQPASTDPAGVDAANAQPPTEPQAAPVASRGKSTDSADMVANKNGAAGPPKKWLHDGGVTVLARGEQSVDRIADSAASKGSKSSTQRVASRHSRKNTQFATLDVPNASDTTSAPAQAYAASTAGVETAPPQNAIAQAITPTNQQTTSDLASDATDHEKSADVKPRHKAHASRAVAKTKATASSAVAELRP